MIVLNDTKRVSDFFTKNENFLYEQNSETKEWVSSKSFWQGIDFSDIELVFETDENDEPISDNEFLPFKIISKNSSDANKFTQNFAINLDEMELETEKDE